MGLGPTVCDQCEVYADYVPNPEFPNRQGDWICPSCKQDCHGSLFMYPLHKWDAIKISTKIIKENQG